MKPRVRIVHPNLPDTYERTILVTERSARVWEKTGWIRHTDDLPEVAPVGTVVQVLEWVDSDPARARTALIAELGRPWPRSTLSTQLQSILEEE